MHECIGCGLNRSRPLLDLTDGVLLGAGPRRLEMSRVQWRASGCQGHQVVVHGHSEQGCALVGLCLSMCEVGVRHFFGRDRAELAAIFPEPQTFCN